MEVSLLKRFFSNQDAQNTLYAGISLYTVRIHNILLRVIVLQFLAIDTRLLTFSNKMFALRQLDITTRYTQFSNLKSNNNQQRDQILSWHNQTSVIG